MGRRKPVHARETVRLQGATSRIVAVADTHGQPHPEIDRRLEESKPDHILHAGDVGDLRVLRQLAKHAPVTAVRGNIDGHDLPDFVTVDLRNGNGEVALVRILVTHIAIYGTKLRADVDRVARAEDAQLVVCGHSHVPFVSQDRGVTVFNPGSAGPRRFRLPILLGVIDVSVQGISLRHVDCETGHPWRPGRSAQPK